MRKLAIILGSWAHRRSTITWKALSPGYEATVIAGGRSACYGETDLGLPVRRLTALRDIVQKIPKIRNKFGWGADQYLFGLEKALDDYDIVLSSSPTCLFSYQAARYCRRAKKPFVLQEIEIIPFLDHDRRIYPKRELAIETAEMIFPATERAKAKLVLEGVREEKLRIIPFGIDTELFNPRAKETSMRGELGFDDEKVLVLFAGRLEWAKGIYDFVNAAKLLEGNRALHFLIAGNGPEASCVKRRIGQLGISERVTMVPQVPFERMPELYGAADMVAAPSIPMRNWIEQWGLVLSEAMAVGVPVIASRTGAVPEVVGDAGMIVQPSDPVSLSEAIEKLAGDAGLRGEMGEAGRGRAVDIWDWRVVGREWSEALDGIE